MAMNCCSRGVNCVVARFLVVTDFERALCPCAVSSPVSSMLLHEVFAGTLPCSKAAKLEEINRLSLAGSAVTIEAGENDSSSVGAEDIDKAGDSTAGWGRMEEVRGVCTYPWSLERVELFNTFSVNEEKSHNHMFELCTHKESDLSALSPRPLFQDHQHFCCVRLFPTQKQH